jgi:hypothetical protein
MPEKLTREVVEDAPDITPRDVVDKEALLQELATLDLIAYDNRRKEAAELLGCRAESLDREVAKRRPKSPDASEAAQGEAITTLDIIPWDTPVDGPALVQDILDLITRYVVLPQDAALAVALWVLHTYVYDLFYVSPRLHITSPQKRCGKSYLVTLTALLAHRAVTISNITPASLFRLIAQYQVTVVMDEADTFMLGNEDLRGILNAGHTKETAYILRTVGDDHEVRRFSVWAPTVIAGIGRLPETVQDRAITIALKRKKSDEGREDLLKALRKHRVQPLASTLRQQCLRWAQDTLDTLRQSDPAMPSGVHDRDANNWEPLLAIADAVGGKWPTKARQAISTLVGQDNAQDTTPAILLLHDMQVLFDHEQTDRLFTHIILEALHKMDDRPWAEYGRQRRLITATQISRLLIPFGIKSGSVRIGPETAKGYKREDCQDAFDRYLHISPSDNAGDHHPPDSPSSPVTPSHARNGADCRDAHTVTHSPNVTAGNVRKPASHNDGDGVTAGQTERWRQDV